MKMLVSRTTTAIIEKQESQSLARFAANLLRQLFLQGKSIPPAVAVFYDRFKRERAEPLSKEIPGVFQRLPLI